MCDISGINSVGATISTISFSVTSTVHIYKAYLIYHWYLSSNIVRTITSKYKSDIALSIQIKTICLWQCAW